jgi:hypothetical protein
MSVHDPRGCLNHRPELVAIDQLFDRGAAMANELGDLVDGQTRVGKHRRCCDGSGQRPRPTAVRHRHRHHPSPDMNRPAFPGLATH